jgi:adenylate kinase family enzyme/aminoglycoside N3'-acetyltransferase
VSGITTEREIAQVAKHLGIGGQALCLHASLRSFPKLERGPKTLIDGLLSTGATVMVATMSGEWFGVPPPRHDRPACNAMDYVATDDQAASAPWRGFTEIYDPSRVEVDAWLGTTSAYVASRPDRVRAPLSGTFSAVGRLASQLVSAETEADVFGPLRALRDADGWVVLAGVGLTTMTMLHLAEVEAGRRPFVRWMRASDGNPMRIRVGECSGGFERLAPVLASQERRALVGASRWRAYPARAVLALAVDAIRSDPSITRCGDPDCRECPDAIAGGPIDEPRSWLAMEQVVSESWSVTQISPGASLGKRIVVTGLAGAGKSTFSRALSTKTGLPVIHLDLHFWKPGWTEPSEEEWRETQRALLASDEWIADGNYHETLDLRLDRADTVILLDTPWWLCASRAFRRGIRRPAGTQMPDGCEDSTWRRVHDEWGVIWRIWRARRTDNERELEIAKRRADRLAVHVLRSKRAIRDLLSA